MPRKLKNIILDEVSLVDRGADPNAHVTIFKRATMTEDEMQMKMQEYMDKGYSKEEAKAMCMSETKKGAEMDPTELAEKLEAMEGQVADLTKRAEGAEAKVAAFEKAADEAGFDVEDGKLAKRADPEYIEVEGERIAKSAVPAVILKALEAKEAELNVAKAKERETEIAKRGEEVLPHLAGTSLAKGKLLEAIGDNEELLKSLKSADAAIAKAMQEIGSNPLNDDASATYRLNKMANDYAAENKVPFETAYSEVTKSGEGAKLMAESRTERN